MQGKKITISGISRGGQASETAIWVFGPGYSDRFIVNPDSTGSYSMVIDTATTRLDEGNYHVVVQHPGLDRIFDVTMNGDYIRNSVTSSDIFRFRGSGRLTGDEAYGALLQVLGDTDFNNDVIPKDTLNGNTPIPVSFHVSATAAPVPDTTTIPLTTVATPTGTTTTVPPTATEKPAVTATTALPSFVATPAGTATTVPPAAAAKPTGTAATTMVTISATPTSNGTSIPANGTLLSGSGTLKNLTTGSSKQIVLPTHILPDPDPSVSGNSPFDLVSTTGSGAGSLPLGGIAVLAGIVLAGGVGGMFLVSRREQAGTKPGGPVQKPSFSFRSSNAKTREKKQATPPGKTVIPAGTGAGTPSLLLKNSFPEELTVKYTEISTIGSGGFAIVYSAYRTADNRKVAVKIPIRHDEQTGKSFLTEMTIWKKLHHPNIVEVMDANILPVPYVEMEFVQGSLEAIPRPLPVESAARIISDITGAIRFAHEQRVIHRDIKPQNILIDDNLVPKITDWGMSKLLEENAKKTTMAGFSLVYAAPEQIAPEKFGSTDERTDIYQIGVVFYELATGSIPFSGVSMMEMVDAILYEEPILPSRYNPDAAGVDTIILKCLAKDPDKRYQSAGELLGALREYLDTCRDNNP